MTTKADTLWVGLLTEAGEVKWPSYRRIKIGKTRPVKVKFALELDEETDIMVFGLIGLYSSEKGGRCQKLIEVRHTKPIIVEDEDVVSFVIE